MDLYYIKATSPRGPTLYRSRRESWLGILIGPRGTWSKETAEEIAARLQVVLAGTSYTVALEPAPHRDVMS